MTGKENCFDERFSEFLDYSSTDKAHTVHLVSSEGNIKSKNARGKGADVRNALF